MNINDIEIIMETRIFRNWLNEHDKQIRAEAIEEYRKEMHDMIEGDEEFTDWQKYEILQCNELVTERVFGKLKEKK